MIALLETKYLDYNFFYWTVRRGASTLRDTVKLGRESQRVVSKIEGYESTVFPDRYVRVIYDTGIDKVGKVIKVA